MQMGRYKYHVLTNAGPPTGHRNREDPQTFPPGKGLAWNWFLCLPGCTFILFCSLSLFGTWHIFPLHCLDSISERFGTERSVTPSLWRASKHEVRFTNQSRLLKIFMCVCTVQTHLLVQLTSLMCAKRNNSITETQSVDSVIEFIIVPRIFMHYGIQRLLATHTWLLCSLIKVGRQYVLQKFLQSIYIAKFTFSNC